jgi:hypothetical protein
MKLKPLIAMLVFVAAPVCAQAQRAPATKADMQNVFKIISEDKPKIQAFCDIGKIGDEMEQANAKGDSKKVEELSLKADELGKQLGPEYAALMDGIGDVDPESESVWKSGQRYRNSTSCVPGRSGSADVRFTPESGHVQCNSVCPLCAISGHWSSRKQKDRPTAVSPKFNQDFNYAAANFRFLEAAVVDLAGDHEHECPFVVAARTQKSRFDLTPPKATCLPAGFIEPAGASVVGVNAQSCRASPHGLAFTRRDQWSLNRPSTLFWPPSPATISTSVSGP